MREPLQNHSSAKAGETDAPCLMVVVPKCIGMTSKGTDICREDIKLCED
jgi:hypothetical protein